MHRCSYCTALPPFFPTLNERKLYHIMLNILGILKRSAITECTEKIETCN